jgi:hypothetical protein
MISPLQNSQVTDRKITRIISARLTTKRERKTYEENVFPSIPETQAGATLTTFVSH